MREFDLNIERMLENWTVAHALREVIANALDEQALTGTVEPDIFQDSDGWWHIRDYGRGIRYEHLTQNENREKLAHPDKVVGKFGVGLKDALATFDRQRITVVIKSRHGDITTGRQAKHGFTDIRTLHALITEPTDAALAGTDVALRGTALGAAQVAAAKALFLHYAGDEELGSTQSGSVLRPPGTRTPARIYVNGLRVAEEDNFLFSYNITPLPRHCAEPSIESEATSAAAHTPSASSRSCWRARLTRPSRRWSRTWRTTSAAPSTMRRSGSTSACTRASSSTPGERSSSSRHWS